jgi:hypothetical protein
MTREYQTLAEHLPQWADVSDYLSNIHAQVK